MSNFSIAEQTILDPMSGSTAQFIADPNDFAICILRVWAKDTNDYLEVRFRRHGAALSAEMVDFAALEDQRERDIAYRRLRLAIPSGGTDEEKKAAAEAHAKQLEADKQLLASKPKVSKFSEEGQASAKKEKSSGSKAA